MWKNNICETMEKNKSKIQKVFEMIISTQQILHLGSFLNR